MSFVQTFLRRFRHGFMAVVAVAAITLSPVAVHADDYTNGVYGDGVYGSSTEPSTGSAPSGSSGASSVAEPTIVETDSGLQVAINLTNGQEIPSNGYYITITPLNGQGKSFDKVEIYLDGKLAYSGAPDETGTLRWLWETATNPATKVKIVVFGPGEGTTTHEFDVTVAPSEPTANSTVNPSDTGSAETTPSTDAGWPFWLVLALGLGLLLIVILVWWLIARRRRHDDTQQPPTVFTPMQ